MYKIILHCHESDFKRKKNKFLFTGYDRTSEEVINHLRICNMQSHTTIPKQPTQTKQTQATLTKSVLKYLLFKYSCFHNVCHHCLSVCKCKSVGMKQIMMTLSAWLWICCVHWFYDDINSNWIFVFLYFSRSSSTIVTYMLNVIVELPLKFFKYFTWHYLFFTVNISNSNFGFYEIHSQVLSVHIVNIYTPPPQHSKVHTNFLSFQLPNWVAVAISCGGGIMLT